MPDRELALTYLPAFFADEREPFPIRCIGWTVFRKTGPSASCPRTIPVAGDCAAVLEYAVYFDYDIQHLYDLEHVFLYLGGKGEVVDAEASFHGWFFKSKINGDLKFENGTHPVFYFQPGKHAVMPDPKYFYLYRDLYPACSELAGDGGFLVAPMFRNRLATDARRNAAVRAYIRRCFSFTPSMKFTRVSFDTEALMPYNDMETVIEERLRGELSKIESRNCL